MKMHHGSLNPRPAVTVKGIMEHDRRFVAVMAFQHINTIHGKVWRLVTDAGNLLELTPDTQDGYPAPDLNAPPDRIESLWGGIGGRGSEFGWAIEKTLSAHSDLELKNVKEWNAAGAAHEDEKRWTEGKDFPEIQAFEEARKKAQQKRRREWKRIKVERGDRIEFQMEQIREQIEKQEQKELKAGKSPADVRNSPRAKELGQKLWELQVELQPGMDELFLKAKEIQASKEYQAEDKRIKKYREGQEDHHRKRIDSEKREVRKNLDAEILTLWKSTAKAYGVKLNRTQARKIVKVIRDRRKQVEGLFVARSHFLVEMLDTFEGITGEDIRPAIRAEVLPDWPNTDAEWLAGFEYDKHEPDFDGTFLEGFPTWKSRLWPLIKVNAEAQPNLDEEKVLERLAGMSEQERGVIQEAKQDKESKRGKGRPAGSNSKSDECGNAPAHHSDKRGRGGRGMKMHLRYNADLSGPRNEVRTEDLL